MVNPTISLRHDPSHEEQRCTGCNADFVPSEDSGSRRLTYRSAEHSFAALFCGGCHSKWSHGSPLTCKGPLSA
jgi:uncharacterized protein with PIN domain